MAASELLLNIFAFTLSFVIYSNCNVAEASRLNVPRVLLPIFNDFPVNFTLEVTEGGCYQWSTSRLDVVHLIPMNENTERTCSSAVLVQSVIKDASRNTAIVLAEDINTAQVLRCDVIVDAIHSLNMVTTTRELFIEEAPEAFEVRAYDEQGNEFTTLAGIEFEWTIANGERHIVDNNINENNILRFMTFHESPYETPPTVSMLDGTGKYGSIILLEGVKTGTAQVSAKLPYNEYKQVPMVEVELIVVANLIILPTDVTMMAYDSFVYKIMQVHQGRLERINLPSSQYYLIAKQPDILEINNGRAYALKEGKSKVLLHDKNVNEDHGVVLPTASVHVTAVKYIMITLLPNKNHGMILGQSHEIVVELYNEKDHKFHIGESIEVSVEINEEFIDTKSITKNGTYIIGIPISCGRTVMKAHLHGVVDKYGRRVLLPNSLDAKAEFTIHTPVIVSPRILSVPWDPNSKSRLDVALKANGGDGTYSWTSRHPKIAAVSQNGVIRILSQGTTNVIVSMASNQYNHDMTILHVMLPTRLEIIHYNMDAAIGESIHLHIALYGKIHTDSPNGTQEIPFTDCRDTSFEMYISDGNFVRNSSASSTHQPIGNACTTLVVVGTRLGSSTITVAYNVNGQYLTDNITVSAYERLVSIHPASRETLLAVGSSRKILFKGGPVLSPFAGEQYNEETSESYNRQITVSNDEIVEVLEHNDTDFPNIYVFEVICRALGDVTLTFKISNDQNKLRNCRSSGATANIRITCGKPRSIHLQPEFKDSENCPIGRNTNRIMAHCEKPLNLSVTVKDDNGKIFDNITSFNIEWAFNPAGSGTAKVINGISEDTFIDYDIVFPKNHYQTIIPKQHTGSLIISAKVKEYQKSILSKLRITPESPAFPIINNEGDLETPLISTDIKLILVNDTTIIPNTIKILNDPNAKYSLKVSQGSGYYEFILSTNDVADIRYIEPTKTISITPKKSGTLRLAMVDLCLVSDPAVAEIQVQQLAGIKIDSVNKVEKGKCIIAVIKLFDTDGNLITLPSIDALDLRSEVENSFIEMKPLLATEQNSTESDDSHNGQILYVIHGIEEGETRITFISGNNEEEIRSESLTIQVFLPLKITQKNVTLLIGSIYQVLTTGGPINAEIEFHVDDHHQDVITTINENDIFEGRSIGKASIIAKAVGVDSRGNRVVYSQDHVDISVSQLEGIRIVSPTSRIKIGATVPLWAFGIPDHLNPLIIGSIRSHLIFSWSSSDSNVLSLNNMYDGTGINIRYQNKVTLRAKALKSGIATVYLNVTTQTPTDDFTFSTFIKIEIIEELVIITPDVSHGLPILLMTPNSSLKLKTNRDRHGSTSYKIISSGHSNDFDDPNALESSIKSVTVDKTGVIKTGDTFGRTILSITNIESYNFKQSLTVVVDVKPIHYMMLSLDSNIRIRAGEELNVLPKGMELDYIVEYFDNLGNKFHATDTKVDTIANRADLTTFIPYSLLSVDKISVKFHESGELVAKVYHHKYPTEMFDYVHMVIGDIVFPSKTILTVGDVVCFSMPLLASDTGEPGFWQSSVPQILMVDGMTGIGVSKKPGQTIVKHSFTSKFDKKGEIEVIVQPISKISLVLLRGKNITGSQVFSVPLVLKSRDEEIKENNILARGLGGCRTQNSFPIDSFPFACKLQFTSSAAASIDINDIFITKPRFDIVTGFYYCDIIPIGSPTLISSTLETKVQVDAHSRDGRDVQAKSLEIAYLPPIYIESTDVVFLQQIPQTVGAATLDVYGLTSVLNHVSLEIPDGIVIDAQELTSSNQLHLKLKLMQDRDDLQGQYLMIVNRLTMQNISMLIRISKHHDFVQLSGIHWISYMYSHRFTFITLIVLIITIIYVWKNKIASIDLTVKNNSIFADKCPPPLQKSPQIASNTSFNATNLNNSMSSSAIPRQSPDSPLRPFSAFEAVYGDPRGFYTPNAKRNISLYSS